MTSLIDEFWAGSGSQINRPLFPNMLLVMLFISLTEGNWNIFQVLLSFLHVCVSFVCVWGSPEFQVHTLAFENTEAKEDLECLPSSLSTLMS